MLSQSSKTRSDVLLIIKHYTDVMIRFFNSLKSQDDYFLDNFIDVSVTWDAAYFTTLNTCCRD